MPATIEPARDEAAVDQTCIIPGCNRIRETRGLCRACYTCALRAIRHGHTDWETMQKNKLILPAQSGRRPNSSPMKLAIDALKQTNGNGHANPTSES